MISAYAAMTDIRKKVTPDIKEPGSVLLLVDLAAGKHRWGGSALAQTLGQIGSEVPDMENPTLVKQAFLAVQELIDQGLILAGHDRSDGGLITTVLEMAFSGNCGLNLALNGSATVLETLFSEELGLVIQCQWSHLAEVKKRFKQAGPPCAVLGSSTVKKAVTIQYNGELVMDDSMAAAPSGGRKPAISWNGCRSTPTAPMPRRLTRWIGKGRNTASASSPRPRRHPSGRNRANRRWPSSRRGVQPGSGDEFRLLTAPVSNPGT